MSVEIKEVILPQIKEFNTMENQKGYKKDSEKQRLQRLLRSLEWMLLFLVILG
jgi:hypothetical protein